jgi:hypothetical protein
MSGVPALITETRLQMYDMYAWSRQNPPEEHEQEASDAVQIALDRRDNGGPVPGVPAR